LKKIKGLPRAKSRGFTLIELLIVIAIIAILAIIVVLTINPARIMEKSRDSQRMSDLTSLATAINLYLADSHDFAALITGNDYLSTDGTDQTRRLNDGTGWVPLDFTVVSSGAPISALPVDPQNKTLNGKNYWYIFGADVDAKTYELDCIFESSDNTSKHGADGGDNADRYEVGTDLTILGA